MSILSFTWPWNAVVFIAFLLFLDLLLFAIAEYLSWRRRTR